MIRRPSVVLTGEHRDGRGRIAVGPLRARDRIEAVRDTMRRAGYRDIGEFPLTACADFEQRHAGQPEGAPRVTHAEMVDIVQGRLPDEVASALVAQVDADREADLRERIVDALEAEAWRIRLADGVGSSTYATIRRAIAIASGDG